MDNEKATELNRLLTMVKQDEQALAVIVFGSAARDEQAAFSDIDMCL